MTKTCIDKNSLPGPTSIWIKDKEIIWTGIVINSMGVNCKNETYETYANEYDIQFIFDDNIPVINFYTVPMVDVFAIDSDGGYIASVGEETFLGSNAPICYINKNKECFLIADNFSSFINKPENWKETMKPYIEIEIFGSMEEAKIKYEFLDVTEFKRRIRNEK